MTITKSSLAIKLSKLKTFDKAKLKIEQYPCDSEIAAEVLWHAYMKDEIKGKTIADLGAGTGILGIGALLLGAKKVFFIDIDKEAIKLLKQNLKQMKNYEIINKNISEFDKRVDIVIQNPPFGTKTKHADKEFLEKAFKTAKIIYSFHKTSTKLFVKSFANMHGFLATDIMDFKFPLKQTQKFHKRKIQRIEVSCFRMEKD